LIVKILTLAGIEILVRIYFHWLLEHLGTR